MNKIEREKLRILSEDETTLGALRKLAGEVIGDEVWNLSNSNESLGALLRAREEAKKMVEDLFSRIKDYQKPEVEKQRVNPGI